MLCGSAPEAPSTCPYSSPVIREGPRDARELGEPGDLEGPVTLQGNAERARTCQGDGVDSVNRPFPIARAHDVIMWRRRNLGGLLGRLRALLSSGCDPQMLFLVVATHETGPET